MSFVEFQIFDGVELRPWISWLEDFFVREDFTTDEKLNLAQSLLESEAESWLNRRQKVAMFQTWEALKRSLLFRFGNFDDLERIKLISEQDQILRKQRDAAKIRRMKTNIDQSTRIDSFCGNVSGNNSSGRVINAKESIETELIHEKELKQSIEEKQSQHVDKISEELKELKKIEDLRNWKIESQLQSRLTSQSQSLNVNRHINANGIFPNIQDDQENVVRNANLENKSTHKNIKREMDNWDIVSSIVERPVYQKTTKLCAHQLFDIFLRRVNTMHHVLKKQKSLKCWRFKFKTKTEEDTLKDQKRLFEKESFVVAVITQEESKFQLRHTYKIVKWENKPQLQSHFASDAPQFCTCIEIDLKECFHTFCGRLTIYEVWHCWKRKTLQHFSFSLLQFFQQTGTRMILCWWFQLRSEFLHSIGTELAIILYYSSKKWSSTMYYEYSVLRWRKRGKQLLYNGILVSSKGNNLQSLILGTIVGTMLKLFRNVYFSVWHCWRKKNLQIISLKHWRLHTSLYHLIQGPTVRLGIHNCSS